MKARLAVVAACSTLLTISCAHQVPQLPPPLQPLSATPDQAFRNAPPQVGARPPLRLPEVHRQKLDNGLTLILLNRPGAKTAAVRYVTRQGGENGPADAAGRAWFVGKILQRTVSETSDGSWSSLAAAGLPARARASYESGSLSLWLPRDRLPRAIDLVAKAVRSPNFAPEQIEAVRLEALRQIRRFWRTPEHTMGIRGKGLLYGPSHRGALPVWGTEKMVRGVNREELLAFHASHWGPADSALIVVGDMESGQFRTLAGESFGDWESKARPTAAPAPWLPVASQEKARVIVLQSSSPQSTVFLMERAPARTHADAMHFELLTTVLGGMFCSRLNLSLRENRGYAYGVHAVYDARLDGGELLFETEVSQQRVGGVLQAVVDELRRLTEQGPTQEELTIAQAVARERLSSSFEGSDDAANTLAAFFVAGEDISEVRRYEAQINSATPALVKAVARRWVRPDRAPILVTGDSNIIAPAFNAAKIGPTLFIPLR